MLARWSRRFPHFTLITQNVDGLHERAFAKATARPAGPTEVIRLHGSIWEVSCWRGCAGAPARWRDDTVPFPALPPACPHCGGLTRPGVVWFGEALDPEVVELADAAARCDVFLTVGTSSVVYPAAGLTDVARRHGAFTVEINPEATPASNSADLVLREPAERILPVVEGLLPNGG